MAISGTQVSVTTSAVLLVDSSDTDNQSGTSALLIMEGAGPVYLDGVNTGGKPSTSTSAKWDKAVVVAINLDLEPGESLYGKVASGTTIVHVVKTGA